jgi:hypothetical protein
MRVPEETYQPNSPVKEMAQFETGYGTAFIVPGKYGLELRTLPTRQMALPNEQIQFLTTRLWLSISIDKLSPNSN